MTPRSDSERSHGGRVMKLVNEAMVVLTLLGVLAVAFLSDLF